MTGWMMDSIVVVRETYSAPNGKRDELECVFVRVDG